MSFALLAVASLLAAGPAPAPQFDPKPWLEDLDQAQQAFAEKYANLEWLVFERKVDVSALFADARASLIKAENDAQARAIFERLASKTGDGHLELKWTEPAGKIDPPLRVSSGAQGLCETLGYDAKKIFEVFGENLPGYSPLKDSPGEFPSGMVTVGVRRLGILRIGIFSPQGSPALCEGALAKLKIAPDAKCDAACADQIEVEASAQMTRDLAAQLRALKKAGAQALMIDLTNNGGGTEWAEAALRMMTPLRVSSERIAFVRGEHWQKAFEDHLSELRKAAKGAKGADARLLHSLADSAARELIEAKTPCDSAPLFKGQHPSCAWLGRGTFGSGLLDAADPKALSGKPWATLVFNPMWFPYEEGVWRGPLLVLVDGETWSAAEEFAAVLQDNRAAVIVGEHTGGAGCGHTNGGTPTLLKNSHAKLLVPDCVRLRGDGSNEVDGIRPDVTLGAVSADGNRKRGALLLSKLPEAIEQAQRLRKRAKR